MREHLTDRDQTNLLKEFPILRYFEYQHLPTALGAVSAQFHDLAWKMAVMPTIAPAELSAGLRKLLEAKDCFVRAAF